MSRRYPIPPVVQNLFRTVPLESGGTDVENIMTFGVNVPHSTFARIRVRPPASATREQLLLIARLVQRHTPFSAADVLALVRGGRSAECLRLRALAIADVRPRTVEGASSLASDVRSAASAARRIYLFDRADSFAYLRPPEGDVPFSDVVEHDSAALARSRWLDRPVTWRYERRPRIAVTLTAASLAARLTRYGDEGVEQLIENVEGGDHSLSVLGDDRRSDHRVFRGIFADARAVAIFDDRTMFVLPAHGNTIRTYDARVNPEHGAAIRAGIMAFRHMRRFRAHGTTQVALVSQLRRLLSYRLPIEARQEV